MGQVRKDTNGIVLNPGEYQQPNGRYRYRYYTDNGKAVNVYAWRLRPQDKPPEGRKREESLREKEKRIQRELAQGVKVWRGNMTVRDLVSKYVERKTPTWKAGTREVLGRHAQAIKDSKIGKMTIGAVEPSHVEGYYMELTASNAAMRNAILSPAFDMAVKNRAIMGNPCKGALGAAGKTGKGKHKEALTDVQKDSLLDFARDHGKRHYEILYLLAWTGARIGEVLALEWEDIDFQSERIHVHKTLLRDDTIQDTPKSDAGNRYIPMLRDVKAVLLSLRREGDKVISLDTWQGRIFDVNYTAMVHWFNAFLMRYSKSEGALDLPYTTLHTFRHTFCCWLIENYTAGGSMLDTLKAVQYIMGHTDAATTLNIYSELRADKLKESFDALKILAAK